LVYWYRNKYNLPPNSPLLDGLTIEDVEIEFWAHQYYNNPKMDLVEDDDWDADEILAQIESGEWESVIHEQ
jgi:hypothetical protein